MRLVFAAAALAIVVLRIAFFELVEARGPTMAPALVEGDIALAQRLPTPELGDIVLVEAASGPPLLRRVVGVPGDTVGVTEGVLTRRGQTVETTAIAPFVWTGADDARHRQRQFRERLADDIVIEILGTAPGLGQPHELRFDDVEVPPGHFMVLCDNRPMCPKIWRDGAIGSHLGGLVSADAVRAVVSHLMWYGARDSEPPEAPFYGAFRSLTGRASTTSASTGRK